MTVGENASVIHSIIKSDLIIKVSSSEAAALAVARALAQGADTLILIDALAPLSADRQMELLNRLGFANCRIFVFSSVSDLWEGDVVGLD